jgi:hypothetical protein
MSVARNFGAAALACACVLATNASADYLADRARPYVEASHAEMRVVHLGRYMARERWNQILDEALYTMAPKGRWGPEHPSWAKARAALERAMREQSVVRLREHTLDWLRRAIDERYSIEPEKVEAAAAFYESPGGRVFRDYREKVLADESYGLPFVVETISREESARQREAARQALLDLPDEQTQAVYDFNHSELGDFLMGVENNILADIAGNIMRSEIESVLNEHGDEIKRAVHAAVPGMPALSDKAYLGTVTMRPDRTLDLAIEYHDGYRMAGTYDLSFAPTSSEWKDITGAVTDMKPGEKRFLYRDPRGRLSDTP